MTFAYMDSGRWMVQPLLGLTTDTLSLYGMCIPASGGILSASYKRGIT